MSDNAFCSTRKFYDLTHFPHGFSRSGEFTRHEAHLLEACGHTIDALLSGKMHPACAEHHTMLAVISGARQPQSELERLWYKYQRKIAQRKGFLHYSLRPSGNNPYLRDQNWGDQGAV